MLDQSNVDSLFRNSEMVILGSLIHTAGDDMCHRWRAVISDEADAADMNVAEKRREVEDGLRWL